MPSKYTIKPYAENGYYHVFNRGIGGLQIFKDEEDYKRFLSYMEEGLTPRDDTELKKLIQDLSVHYKKRREATQLLNRKNFSDDIKLYLYSLIPNRFDLLLQQRQISSMQEFMRALLTRFSMYYNKKYSRKGTLFESAYKAIQIKTEEKLLALVKEIHRRPVQVAKDHNILLSAYHYSSYRYFLNNDLDNPWLTKQLVESIYAKHYPNKSLREFVEPQESPSQPSA